MFGSSRKQRVNEREKEREREFVGFRCLKRRTNVGGGARALSLSLSAFHPLSHSLSMSLSHTFSRSPLPFGRAHHRQICQFFKHQRWNEVSKLWSYLRVVSLSLKKVTLFSFQCIRKYTHSPSLSLSHTHTHSLSTAELRQFESRLKWAGVGGLSLWMGTTT